MFGGNDRLIHAGTIHAVDPLFQPERVRKIIEVIANTHAPSQTVHYTRAVAIQQLLQEYGNGNYEFDANYAKTGNILLSVGKSTPKILFLAHADEISYLVGEECDDGSWKLIPYCTHRADASYNAIAMRYQTSTRQLEQVATGTIKPIKLGDKVIPHFYLSDGCLQPGDRIVYDHKLSIDGDITRGSIDNSAGVTACLLAAIALCQALPETPVAFAFTDEEEGPPVYNSTFARGARRLIRRLDSPEFYVNVDGHDISQWCSVGGGAVFAEKSSDGKGAVVPPHLYAAFRELTNDMLAQGIHIKENLGYVSRSDDVALIEMTPNILLLGYPVKDPHFNQSVPSASINDILNLSKAVFLTAIGLTGL